MDKLKDTLDDLAITGDEVKKLSDAFKNEEFRKLFREYAEELQDPENRKKYEEELTAMENERGMDVEFINPSPGHVLKTIQNGEKKIFVNICCSEKMAPATMVKNGKGTNWSIPHSFSPPREDIDKKKDACLVYDVVFNPQTYKLSVGDLRFRQMLNDTALQGIENTFKVSLDKNNVRVLKIKMKGCPTATVIRKKKTDYEERQKDLKDRNGDPLIFPYPDEATETQKMSYDVHGDSSQTLSHTRPVYSIKYSSQFDVANYVGERVHHSSRPKKVIIDIKLPLVASAQCVDLDIDDLHMTLSTEKPVKYRLELKFTYPVLSEKGTAKFDKTTRILKLDLPIVQLPEEVALSLDESDFSVDQIEAPKRNLIDDSFPLVESKDDDNCTSEDIGKGTSPENKDRVYVISQNENIVVRKSPLESLRCRTNDFFAFILCDIKNVDMEDTNVICPRMKDSSQNVVVNFSTCGAGGWKTCYTLPLTLTLSGPEYLDQKDIICLVTKENIIVRIAIPVGAEKVTSVCYMDQIISLEKKNAVFNWRNIDDEAYIREDENESQDSFQVVFGNVNKDTLKIICAPLNEIIILDNEFHEETETSGLEEDFIDEENKSVDDENSEMEMDDDFVVNGEIKYGDSENGERVLNEDFVADEEIDSETEDNIEPPKADASEIMCNQSSASTETSISVQTKRTVLSECPDERRDVVHKTFCAVELDEKLLFDME